MTDVPLGRAALAPESAALLGRFAAQRGRSHVVTVAPEPVADLEAALGSAIPFDVIALLALEERALVALRDLTEEIATYYRVESQELGRPLARELAWKHVAFASLDAAPEEPRFAAFPRGADRTTPTLVEWILRKPSPGAHPYSLARYLEERWRLSAAPSAPPIELVLESPKAAIVHATHAKFGRGRVLSRADGKATVEFADGTTRRLADQFLRFE